MKLIKNHKITLITVLLAIIFFITISMGTYSVFARTVEIAGSNFFYTNGESSVRVHKEDADEYYTMFNFAEDEDNVTYRYNLAYHWYQASDADETVGEEGWFNLTFGFETAEFERYVIKFQSQQYYKTDDEVTSNYIVLVADGAGYVYCYITDDAENLELTVTEIMADYSVADNEYAVFPVLNGDAVNRITVAFTGYSAGAYDVSITDENSNECAGTFNNVGGNYSKRVNSTTAGVMPLTFTAYLDGDDEDASCDMVLYCLNNQSFLLTDTDETIGTYSEGTDDGNNIEYYISDGNLVTDDCAPVLCIDGNVSYLEYGETIDFDYVVIDVLASSPKSTINYYVLSASIYSAAVESDSVAYFTDNSGDDPIFNKTNDDDTGTILVETTDAFLTEEIIEANKNDSGYTVGCLVKVFVELTDVTSTSGNNATTKVYLDWYMDAAALADVTVGGETCTFIKALTDDRGATYVTGTELEDLTAEYQAKIDELAIVDGEIALTAGSSSEFNLPSFEGFITDNLDGYEDLTYTIYYTVDGEENSTSSLSYNELAISLSSAGSYKFTVYATDKASNDMYYIDDEGNLVEFGETELFDDEVKDYLPWFTFEVVYTGVTVEDPGEQTTGYVDTEYSVSAFDINGVSSYYTTSYSLYRFDRVSFNEYLESLGLETMSYSDFVENLQALFENTYLDGVNTRAYFTTIKELSSLNETDEDYDDYVDYEWSSSSLSFIPQDENSYYLVRLTVSDTYNHQSAVYGYMGIHVSAASTSYSGESDWIANNLASVILFSVAGVALIGIIVLFIIKPKDEVDLDEQLAAEAEGIKAKKAKKSKKNKDN